MTYLTSVFGGAHPAKQVGVRTSREMRTLAEALDALSQGKLPELADLLMQRFKALEVSVTDGNWHVAKQLEVLPSMDLGLTSLAERTDAAKQELVALKLREAGKKLSGRQTG